MINGMNDKKNAQIVIPMIEKCENLNISLDFFNNSLISSLLIKPILFGETKPEIISNGFRYDGLSFL
jgi:HKD family nuclease